MLIQSDYKEDNMDRHKEKRKYERVNEDFPVEFTVLFMESKDFRRMNSSGKIIDSSPAGIGLMTAFPLEAGHILEWDDQHHKGKLHIAMVKWTRKFEDNYRAGLMFV